MANRGQKVQKVPRRRKLSLGLIIGLIVLVYLGFVVFSYLGKEKVSFYEVSEGVMVKDTEHEGLIIRDESIQYAPGSGYINFFITGNKRAAIGTDLYSLDETGGLNRFLENNSLGTTSLTDENAQTIKKEFSSFSSEITDNDFYKVREARYYADSAVMEYAGINTMENLDVLLKDSGISYSRITAPVSGIVSFEVDSYSDLRPENVTGDYFERNGYAQSRIKSGQLIEKNSPVCKIVTSEDWSVIFKLSDEERKNYAEKKTLHISFKNPDIDVSGKFTVFVGTDGNSYGQLDLEKYMVDFIGDRFVYFDIEEDYTSGLKIPKSAVVNKTFLTVPIEYLTKGGDDISDGFLKEVYTQSGNLAQFVATTVYYNDGVNCYIELESEKGLNTGDSVIRPDSQERYRLTSTAELSGVYNINKGYAVFKQIDVIDSNDEFYIVSKNQKYGLSVYDHILFDPTGVNEGDFIYD